MLQWIKNKKRLNIYRHKAWWILHLFRNGLQKCIIADYETWWFYANKAWIFIVNASKQRKMDLQGVAHLRVHGHAVVSLWGRIHSYAFSPDAFSTAVKGSASKRACMCVNACCHVYSMCIAMHFLLKVNTHHDALVCIVMYRQTLCDVCWRMS